MDAYPSLTRGPSTCFGWLCTVHFMTARSLRRAGATCAAESARIDCGDCTGLNGLQPNDVRLITQRLCHNIPSEGQLSIFRIVDQPGDFS
jgi:hypothetical protein